MKWAACALFAVSMLSAPVAQSGQAISGSAAIDGSHSKITVRVFKTGVFSILAHNHEISAPVESGDVKQGETPSVELRVDSRKLHVLDPEVSDDTRAQIQKTMEGPEVLDAERFPEIRFQSETIDSVGPNHWVVHGTLSLHGENHPLAVDVNLRDGLYRGTAGFKQTSFGITPVSVAGGTVKVKDEIKVEFEIALTK